MTKGIVKKERPIVTSKEVAIKNFNAEQFKLQIEDFVEKCHEIQIVDPTSEKIAEEMFGSLNQIIIKLDGRKKILKRPYLDANKYIESAYKYIIGDAPDAIAKGKKKIAAYREEIRLQKEKEDMQRGIELASQSEAIDMKKVQLEKEMQGLFLVEHEAIVKIGIITDIEELKKWHAVYTSGESIINKSLAPSFPEMIKASYDRMTALKNARKAFILESDKDGWETTLERITKEFKASNQKLAHIVDEAVEEQSQELQVAIQAVEIEAMEKPKGRFTWDFEVVDETQIPDEWKMLDPDKVKAFIANNKNSLKDKQEYYGIKFIQKEIVRLT